MLDSTVLDLAERQHGLIERHQALALGLSEKALRHRANAGRLVRVQPGVYRVAGMPTTHAQRLLAACLAAGPESAVSHRAATHDWGLGWFPDIVEVVTPRARWPRLRGVTVHRSTDLRPDQITTRNATPITKPLRTMVDLGAVAAWAVPDALERGLTSRLFGLAAADAALELFSRKGRTGVGVLRAAVDMRALGHDVPESMLESRMARLLTVQGLPKPAYQHWVTPRIRVDFAYPEYLLVIEVDGFAVHGTATALSADLARQNQLITLGWTVLRFTWEQVVRQPETVARTVLVTLSALQGRKA